MAICAGLALILVAVAALRVALSTSPSGRISVPWPSGIAVFVTFLMLYQFVSAVVLRHFSKHLIPLSSGDS